VDSAQVEDSAPLGGEPPETGAPADARTPVDRPTPTGGVELPLRGDEPVDRNDIFGVRRALELLPDDRWDAFLHRWAQLGDRCEYDLNLLRADVIQEADDCPDESTAAAWATIALAMSTYLEWRSGPN
jgi:hypothetical protein